MRAPLAFVVAALVLSGCTVEEAPAQTNAIAPGTLVGVVTDVALVPLAGVNVSVDGVNQSALTDAAGSFSFTLLPGEYLVFAAHAEHKTGAFRTNVLSDQTSTLAFQLEAIPRIVPRVDVAEAEGYLACAALVIQGGERRDVPCGGQDPNERSSVEFGITTTEGLEGVVVELAWGARTGAATTMRLEVALQAGESVVELGGAEGTSPIRLPISGRFFSIGTLVARASPAGSFTDDEAGADAGVALQQPFTVYASSFFHAEPPAGYTAIKASGGE